MKTITEFSSFTLNLANQKVLEVARLHPASELAAEPQFRPETAVSTSSAEATAATDSTTDLSNASEAETPAAGEMTSEAIAAIETQTAPAETPVEKKDSPQTSETQGVKSEAEQKTAAPKVIIKPKKEKPPLSSEAKKALCVELKIDEVKVELLLNALELVRGVRPGLKRVLVIKFDEKEPVPANAKKMGDYYFMAEMIPGLPEKSDRREKGRFGKGGKRHRSKGKRGEKDLSRRGEGQGEDKEGDKRHHRPPRGGRGPKPVMAPKSGEAAVTVVKPKSNDTPAADVSKPQT